MLSWLGMRLVSFLLARIRKGDIRPAMALDAPDIVFHFPGQNSWSGEFHGKEALRNWQQRFVRVGIQIYADEVVLKGFPWNMTLCIRGYDDLRSPSGELVYENRYVIWGRMAWGRVKEYEVYEDTEKVARLDEYLAADGPSLGRS